MTRKTVKVFLFIFYIVAAFNSRSYAQKLSSQREEEKIKLSGAYYWEEEKAFTEDEAKNLAKDYLILRIIKDFNTSENINDIKSIKIEGIEYLVFMRGTKFRVTAFIEKTKVTKQLKTLREMGYFEVIPEDKIDEEKINISENNIKNNGLDSTTNSELNKKKEDVNYRIELSNKADDYKQNNYEEKENTKNTLPAESVCFLYNQIVTQKLKKIKNSQELIELLNEYKKEGKLVYGNQDAFSNADRCDILVLNPDTKTIVAYLVHKDKVFYNYLTQTMVDDFKTTFRGMIAIWIMYFINQY
jgi:hypothetical protein